MTKKIKPKTKRKKTGPKTNWKMKDAIGKLEKAFAIDSTIVEACYYANISIDTYHRWVKEDPKLSDEFKRLRHKPVLKARQTIVDSLEDPKTAAWYLERKRKKEFSQRVETDNTHKIESLESIEQTLKSIGTQNKLGTDKPS